MKLNFAHILFIWIWTTRKKRWNIWEQSRPISKLIHLSSAPGVSWTHTLPKIIQNSFESFARRPNWRDPFYFDILTRIVFKNSNSKIPIGPPIKRKLWNLNKMRDSALTTIVKSYKNNVNIQFFTQASLILDDWINSSEIDIGWHIPILINLYFQPCKMKLL